MISSITSATYTQPAAQATAVNKKSPAAKSQPAPDTQDSVHLSSAAQTQLSTIKAAAQEATETAAQTAKEAGTGDLQAQRLLAKEAAAAKVAEGK
jgi:hypothetical protein